MTDGTFKAIDRDLIEVEFKTQVNSDGSLSPYHVEDAAQRAALLAAITGAGRALTLLDASGVIEHPAQSQPFRFADPNSKFLRITNPNSALGSLWICDALDGNGDPIPAAIDDGISLELVPGETFTWPRGIANQVNIAAVAAGQAFIGRKA